MTDIEFKDPAIIRSTVLTTYDIKKVVEKGFFSCKEYTKETKRFAEKTIFENGQRIKGEIIIFNSLEQLGKRKIKTYENGKLKTCIRYNSSGEVMEKDDYEYNNYGDLLLYHSFDYSINSISGACTIKHEWTYEDNARGTIKTDINSLTKTTTKCYYNSSGQLVQSIEYDEFGTKIETIDFYYDSRGLLIQKVINGLEESRRYNEHGDIIWRKWYPNIDSVINKNYDVVISEFEYTYDNNGNWIEYKVKRNGKDYMLFTRQIEYI